MEQAHWLHSAASLVRLDAASKTFGKSACCIGCLRVYLVTDPNVLRVASEINLWLHPWLHFAARACTNNIVFLPVFRFRLEDPAEFSILKDIPTVSFNHFRHTSTYRTVKPKKNNV